MKCADLYHPIRENADHVAWDDLGEEREWTYWEGTYQDRNLLVWSNEDGVYTRHGKDTGAVRASGEPVDVDPDTCTPEGPMMSWFWPLGRLLPHEDERVTAARMAGLNTCLVKLDDTYGIALTGGGQDLSWDLALSCVQAGFLPWLGLKLDSWEYGVGEIGMLGAKRVRAALRYRIRNERRRLGYRLNRMADWK